ncbi:C1 family peptidase [Methanobrevibacter sp.]|uniref:C1 family peptidase n=1 Tax=Methanobrevibacter sp. TaxID=66852 RepID=UPI0025E2657A|nr:C1 family peptidase [Methanobrevibacter sp.]MBQ2832743.1 hypothetical protein [Methanobrevibacter sp.]
MKFAKICILLLFLIVSIGAVSATEEINNEAISTDNPMETGGVALDDEPTILQSAEHSEYGESEISNTFTDFSKDMNESVSVMEVKHNYKFNNETDKGHILINKDNFIIEGNNHVLDGANQTNILGIKGTNITINNLVFTNGNCRSGGLFEFNGGGAIIALGSLTLNNVTFINNAANYDGGDILTIAELNCFDCNFVDGYSVNGNSICSQMGTVNIERCTFTSKYSSKWSTVYGQGGEVFVNDCLFDNISSAYAPAIYVSGGIAIINNTKFNNLKAYKTAGAVGTKECELTIIENCLFTNTSSFKDGGAIFIDTFGNGDLGVYDGWAYVINSTFINTSSSFGGAYVQLSGNLSLKDSSFINCSSNYDGGAVYTSGADVNVVNCKFNSNKVASHVNYPTYGGAIYFDYSESVNVTDSEFNNNEAPIGSGICIYDCEYHLDNITFNNNGNAVYTYFDGDSSTIGEIYGNDKISQDDLNNTIYPSLVVGQGITLNLTTNNIDLTILPTKFDLRDIGWITPVRDQGSMGSCWTFGALDALESALVKNTGVSYYLSENNVQDVMLIYSRYGVYISEGGFQTNSAAYMVNWFGVFPQEYDTYDELGKISPLIHANQTLHVQDYVLIERNISNPGDPLLKEAILKYGVLHVTYDATQLNPTDYNFYSNSTSSDHAVGLVGWDDNYPKENFVNQPPGDGAWIIKNSWGTEWGEEGYGYISYYDTSLCSTNDVIDQAVGYIIENTLPYNKNYQYDFSGIDDFMTYNETDELYGSPITNVNVFMSEDDDLLAAVGTYFNQSGLDYTVEIAVNDVVVYTQKGISPYRGYHTIKLDKYVPIKKGDKFSVYVTSTALGVSAPARVYCADGVSFTNYGGIWTDIYETYGNVACIKAYTLKDDTAIAGNKNIAVDYAGGSYFSVKVVTADGHAVVGASVKFTIDGKTTTVKTDGNGIAKIKITQAPGKYTIKTAYNGETVKNTVTVKDVLTAYKVTVKKTAKKFTLKAKLKINGKLVKGKTVTFKFNGKTYNVKTNANGIAQKTLDKNVIKKLKKGKTYTVKVTYLKDTIKTTVKVL